ncbi:MAG: GNAT family N-acetyltransferase, partial [Oscillospiraceae bacterium]|nr:GNAT family N-acetyltransferase [Oscillospiraceae bacterium]
MDDKIKIRLARPEDAGELLAIYAPYVEETAVTFECSVPTAEEFRQRIIEIQKKYPYLVAELDGEAVGY